ncbi:MAG: hypothetical protein QJR08_04310 [Bacillota bacterium]|nr:hypothetical protein [Bacillota bacterium]
MRRTWEFVVQREGSPFVRTVRVPFELRDVYRIEFAAQGWRILRERMV